MIVEIECKDGADKLAVWRFKMKAFSGPMFPSMQCIAYPRREIPMTLICVNRENTIRGGGSTALKLLKMLTPMTLLTLLILWTLWALLTLWTLLTLLTWFTLLTWLTLLT